MNEEIRNKELNEIYAKGVDYTFMLGLICGYISGQDDAVQAFEQIIIDADKILGDLIHYIEIY